MKNQHDVKWKEERKGRHLLILLLLFPTPSINSFVLPYFHGIMTKTTKRKMKRLGRRGERKRKENMRLLSGK